jgi:hypothetical protein
MNVWDREDILLDRIEKLKSQTHESERILLDRISELKSQLYEANKAATEVARLVEADPRFETGSRLKTSVLLYVDDILKATD